MYTFKPWSAVLPEQLSPSPAPACDEASDTEPERRQSHSVKRSWHPASPTRGSDDLEEESDPIATFDGPWMLNMATVWCHKAICDAKGSSWRPACRALGTSSA